MSEDSKTTRERLEVMLRRWGARAAADEAPIGAPPAAPTRRRTTVAFVLRWAPAAAAAVLLLAAGATFLLSPVKRPDDKPRSADPGKRAATEALEAELHAARMELQALRDENLTVHNRLSEARGFAADADRARDEVMERAGTLQQALGAEKTEARRREEALKAHVARLKRTTEQLEKLDKARRGELAGVKAKVGTETDLRRRTEGELKRVRARLTVAARELQRQRDAIRGAEDEGRNLRNELAMLRARYRVSLDQARRAYLATAAPGFKGLPALQQAAGRRGLLKRCAALQRAARTGEAKRLLAQAEVALTRLSMLDAADISGVQAFITQLRKDDLVARMDRLGEGMTAGGEMQGWLFETKLILTGVQRVT